MLNTSTFLAKRRGRFAFFEWDSSMPIDQNVTNSDFFYSDDMTNTDVDNKKLMQKFGFFFFFLKERRLLIFYSKHGD